MNNRTADSSTQKMTWLKASLLLGASASMLTMAPSAFAQDSNEGDVVIASGIRQALQTALIEKRSADSLVEIIQAEDIGKLPDQNLAEVLENITGVQITRTAGVGTGVQIRGSNENLVLINGVNTVGSGTSRDGASFQDLAAGIIAGVEVIKAPEASTIEGAIGGSVNLRTIRPLDLKETLASVRIQGEHSSLSVEDNITPRFSGALGKKWENAKGQEIGIVVSGSYTEQEASSLRPRVDRDGSLVENINVNQIDGAREDAVDRPAAQEFDFLGIQFLNQELENFEFDTLNLAGTIEARPTDNLKLYVDGIVTDQERRQDSTRVQGSGVSSVLNQNLPSEFETVDFGSLDGVELGSIQAALVGVIEPNLAQDDDDPNLRFNSDTGARITDSRIVRLGGEWEKGNLSANVEYSYAESETETPTLSTQLNFINPNCPLDASSNDNCVPFRYDLSGGDLTFGINFDSPFAPTVEQLLDPNNVVLDQVDVSQNSVDNKDQAFRIDASYDFEDSSFGSILKSVDVGYRYNELESTFSSRSDRIGGFSQLEDSPGGALFSSILVPGPDNADDADDRDLALTNFVIVDPDLAFNDPDQVLSVLEGALAAHRVANPQADGDLTANLAVNSVNSFSIEEETHAVYGQANFDFGLVRGNVGARYIDTSVFSIGNNIDPNGNLSEVVTEESYDFFLPRVNLVVEPVEDVILRASWSEDISRPDFGDLSTSVAFGTNENASVRIGNPALVPTDVTNYDVSAGWYFAPSALFTIGYFRKDRTNEFAAQTDFAFVDTATGFRETDASCPGGGVFNPSAQANIFQTLGTTGLCVDAATILNDPEELTQEGIETSLQYDLSGFEDSIGFASGFGFIANYTYQKFSGGSATNSSATRGTDIFNAINGIYDQDNFVRVTALQGLLDNSEHAYNLTGYYEKFGLSARLRYTWRDKFRTLDTAAGASLNSTLGFPVTTAARGQLNGSVSYEVIDGLTLGVEAVNLTKSGIEQFCVNDDALLCAQGIADRRITFGASYTF